ncbi:MAG: LLM class flavin-dependent oxidoreductase, partial [Acidimicrobiales bacterium]
IGTVWPDVEQQGLGADVPSTGEWLDRLEEAVQICRAMFTEEAPSFDGRYYRISQAANFPRPVQVGGPPIMVGGTGSRRTLGAVARWADASSATGTTEDVRRHMGILDEHCAKEGRDPATVRRSWLGSLFLCSSLTEADELRADLARAMGDQELAGLVVGDEAGVVEQLQALVAEGLDEVIVNLPFASAAADVQAVGAALGGAFGS